MSDSEWCPSECEPEYDTDFECKIEEDLTHIKRKNILKRTKRSRKNPKRFHDEVFIKGSNNKHTAGRKIDPYERDMSTDE